MQGASAPIVSSCSNWAEKMSQDESCVKIKFKYKNYLILIANRISHMTNQQLERHFNVVKPPVKKNHDKINNPNKMWTSPLAISHVVITGSPQ